MNCSVCNAELISDDEQEEGICDICYLDEQASKRGEVPYDEREFYEDR